MTSFIAHTFAIVRKDLLMEMRDRGRAAMALLFGLLLLIMFSFALSMEPAVMRQMAPGVFWLAILFSAVLTFDTSLAKETSDGQWEGLLLLGITPRALYLGKLIANLCTILVMQLVLLPLMAILFDIAITWSVIGVLLLGSIGIATLGTFYAGVTATLRGGQALLPLLLFPMLVPLLMASVKVTTLVLAHDPFAQDVVWIKLLILFDTIFFFGCLLAADALFEKA